MHSDDDDEPTSNKSALLTGWSAAGVPLPYLSERIHQSPEQKETLKGSGGKETLKSEHRSDPVSLNAHPLPRTEVSTTCTFHLMLGLGSGSCLSITV